jgi:hypothetical protein
MHGHQGPVLEIACSLPGRRASMLDGEGSLLEVEGPVRELDVRQPPHEARAARINRRPLDPFYP